MTSKNDIENLHQISIIIKYPVDGSVLDSFENANSDNILVRAVKKIDW